MANTATTKQILDNLTYDTEVYTAAGVDKAISDALVGGYKIKGNATVAELNTLAPSVAQASATLKVGDVYNLTTAGTLAAAATTEDASVVKGDNVVWTEDGWDLNRGLVSMEGKQDKITASGLLKGDGSGGVTAAVAGTDYVAPVSGKGLSTNDYTTADKAKLDNIAAKANLGFSSVQIEDSTGASIGGRAATESNSLLTIRGKKNVTLSNSGADVELSVADGSASTAGVVKLSDATDGTAAAASGATAATPKAVADALSAAKSYADTVKGDANVIEGVKLAGASGNLTPSSKVVTIPNAVATGETSATNGLMTADDKKKLSDLPADANVGFTGITGTSGNASADATHADVVITGTNITAAVSSNNAGVLVALAVADGSTSVKGVVQLSNSTSDTSTSKAATASAVKSAYDRGSAGVTAAATEKTKRNAVATALSTYDALTQGSSMSDTRALINALLAALKAFGANS